MMVVKNIVLNILIPFAAILVAAACNKENVTANRPEHGLILFNAVEAGSNHSLNTGTFHDTKAMLEKSTFATIGNRLQIFDFVDDASEAYIDDQIGPDVPGETYGFEGVWPFVKGPHQWTPGTHKFFGWLAKDANMTSSNTPEDFFGKDFLFDQTDLVLAIPQTEMTPGKVQFDFMFSDIYSTEPQNDPVKLEFSHLFTAVSVGVENSTSSIVTIKDFKIEGIPSTRSANINFKGKETSVNYTPMTAATFTRGLDTGKYPYDISPNGIRSDIFNGSTTQEFMLLWPIEAELLYSTDKINTTDEGVVEYPESWKMYIEYVADGKTYIKRLNFPNISWEAGKKYHFTIVFADKMVELKTEVNPWEYEEQTIDYTNEAPSLSAGGALTWNSSVSIVDPTNKMVSIYNAQPAHAQFTLQTPIGGSWIVSLVGDVNAFEVNPPSGIINSQTANIYVKPLISEASRDYKVQLKFTIRRSDGRMIAADDIVQAGGMYTIVLPRNN